MYSLVISPSCNSDVHLPTIRLLQGQVCVVGSSTRADFIFDLPGVSPEFFRITCQKNKGFIECIQLSENLLINEDSKSRSKIRDGDIVAFGGKQFRVSIRGAASAGSSRTALTPELIETKDAIEDVNEVLGFDASGFDSNSITEESLKAESSTLAGNHPPSKELCRPKSVDNNSLGQTADFEPGRETVSLGRSESGSSSTGPSKPYKVLNFSNEREFNDFLESIPKGTNCYLVQAAKLAVFEFNGLTPLFQNDSDGCVILLSNFEKHSLHESLANQGLLRHVRFPGAVSQMVWMFPEKKLRALFSLLYAVVLAKAPDELEIFESQVKEAS